jgi:hypothetical protein
MSVARVYAGFRLWQGGGAKVYPAQTRHTVITQFILMGNLTGSVAYWESRKLGKSSTHD